MMARGHLLSGMLVGLATVPASPWSDSLPGAAIWVAACSYGGWAPDLDMPGARLSKALGPVTYVLALGMRALSVVVYDLTRTDQDPVYSDGHRTLTHTLVFPPLLGLALFGLLASFQVPVDVAAPISVGLVLGSWAHIAGDCCTVSGCPLVWPFVVRGRRWYRTGIPRLLRFKTGYRHDDDQDCTMWEASGERVVTLVLYVAVVLVGFGLVPGGYPWVFDMFDQVIAWATGWMR